MLKRKEELNYRKAISTRDGRHNRCKHCGHRMLTDIYGCDGAFLRKDWRCEIVGLSNSRRYAVEADHVCDKVEAMKRDG
jgi:hypothetical protein